MGQGLNRLKIAVGGLMLITSAGAFASAAGKLADYLNAYQGRPAAEIFDRVGYPDRKETYGEDTVYYWGTDQIDGPSCTFKVATGADGLVKSASSFGNDWGCGPSAKRLKPKK